MSRPGPKFEITRDMALENIRTVAQRLGVTNLTIKQYDDEGSFASRVLVRKFGWANLCREVGLTCGLPSLVK